MRLENLKKLLQYINISIILTPIFLILRLYTFLSNFIFLLVDQIDKKNYLKPLNGPICLNIGELIYVDAHFSSLKKYF